MLNEALICGYNGIVALWFGKKELLIKNGLSEIVLDWNVFIWGEKSMWGKYDKISYNKQDLMKRFFEYDLYTSNIKLKYFPPF